jgi:hypothetical protein
MSDTIDRALAYIEQAEAKARELEQALRIGQSDMDAISRQSHEYFLRAEAAEARIRELEQERDRLLIVLRQALIETGCDGDLCVSDWHEMARQLCGEYLYQQAQDLVRAHTVQAQLQAVTQERDQAHKNFDELKALFNSHGAQLQAHNQEMEKALREVDRLAEAGMCQFKSDGKHAFLQDIRSACAGVGIQGGLTGAALAHNPSQEEKP